jgi:hypothetical protein
MGVQKHVCFVVAVALACMAPWVQAQDQKAEIQKRLASQFSLTKITADRTDIVGQAGSILVLQKDGFVMFSTDTKIPPTYTYKGGKLSMGFGASLATDMVLGQGNSGINTSNVPQRKFVAGEKFWVVAYSVKDDGVIIQTYSDPYKDVRYYGQVKFPFQKHNIPPADDVMKTITEVFTVEPPEASSGGDDAAPGNQPPPDAAPAPPKTIALGQTKDEVVAAMGQPQKMVNLGAKEIYIYPDMKITFMNGKVSDVQ